MCQELAPRSVQGGVVCAVCVEDACSLCVGRLTCGLLEGVGHTVGKYLRIAAG